EKLDGTGYPNALRGRQIPIPARMMAISDIYDALTASDRPYKKAMPMEKALDILASDVKRGQLDGDLFHVFISARVWTRPQRLAGASRCLPTAASPCPPRCAGDCAPRLLAWSAQQRAPIAGPITTSRSGSSTTPRSARSTETTAARTGPPMCWPSRS